MRTVFHEQLDTLNEGVADLCERTAAMMQLATDALLHADLDASETVIGRLDDVDRQCAALEADTFTLLARQAPVASDLRAVLSGMRSVADLQRMGALAAHVARITRRRHPEIAVPGEVCGYFAEMGRIAFQLAQDEHLAMMLGEANLPREDQVDYFGGPDGDAGLTGRKIIVDTYGGAAPHGGGAFSGKDPSKVDRSACYYARFIAKNIVAAGLATRCEVQVAYAIGVAAPVSINVMTFGTGRISDEALETLVRAHFDCRPAALIRELDLLRPIYRPTAAYGHFGRNEPNFTWERTTKAAELRESARSQVAA